MKKKIIIGILSGAFILSVGTFTFAQTNDELNFEQMQPFIQKMHPDFTTEEQKQMYDSCHREGSMMNNYNKENTNSQNMLNTF